MVDQEFKIALLTDSYDFFESFSSLCEDVPEFDSDVHNLNLEAISAHSLDHLNDLDLVFIHVSDISAASNVLQRYRQHWGSLPFVIIHSGNNENHYMYLSMGASEVLLASELEPRVLARAGIAALIREKLKYESSQESDYQFRTIVENSTDGIIVVDQDDNVCFANPAVEKIFEQRLNEIVGRKFDFYLLSRQENQSDSTLEDLSLKYISLLSDTGKTAEVEITVDSGETKTIEMRATASPWLGKKAFLVIFHDMTHLIRLQHLKSEIFERKRIAKLKDDFISTISHEIRTPLAIVKCAVENVRDGVTGELNSKQRRVIDIASANVIRLSRLIDDILDLSKLESGRVNLVVKPTSIDQLLHDTARRFSIVAKEQKVFIDVDAPFNIPLVQMDGERVTQILDNLVSNALKFANEKISLKARFIKDLEGFSIPGEAPTSSHSAAADWTGSGMLISVLDDGNGVPKDKLAQIFQKFVQLDREEGGAGAKGTGLGLSICQEIVDLHNGAIWVESELGEGMMVHFILPDSVAIIEDASEENLSQM